MRIQGVDTNLYRIPLKHPWGDSTHRVTHIELIVTDVIADQGLTGTGFSYTVGMGGKAIQALLDGYIVPKIVGAEVVPRVLWNRMWREVHDAGGGGLTTMSLAAMDIALWDLIAKEHQRSLVEVIGRHRPSIQAYGSGVNLNLSLQELEEQVGRWIEAGYNAVKIKVGKPDLVEDVERVCRVRELIGLQRTLMVDANQGWDVTTAVRSIKALHHFDLYWIEEPLLSDDIPGHAQLRQLVDAPIAIGENVYTKYQFNQYLSSGACDFVQADVVRVGGITPFLDIAELCNIWNIPVAPHFMLEIAGQLLCCIPNACILEDVEGGSGDSGSCQDLECPSG